MRTSSTFRIFLAVAALAVPSARPAAADEVQLRNGDRYSGTVVKLASGTLTFKTAHGELGIAWDDVVTLTVDEAIVVRTVDGEETPRLGGTVDIARTTEIARPLPVLAVSGGVAAGLVSTGGNTQVNSFRLDGEVIMRATVNRYTVGGAVNRAKDRGVETARNWTASGRYDRFVTPRLFVNANTILTNDQFRDLELRTAIGTGVGYQILDSPLLRLSLDGGLGFVNENFGAAGDDRYAALREAGKLDVLLVGDRIVFFHQHDGYFGVTGTDNLFVKTQNGVRFSVVGGLVTTVQLDVDYDRSPSPGRRNTDRTLAFTFGYRF